MCITSWVWCASRNAGHMSWSSSLDLYPGPMSQNSCRAAGVFSGSPSSEWRFVHHVCIILCSQEPTRDGSQTTRKPSCFDELNQLSLGCHHLWWQWEKTLDVAAGCRWCVSFPASDCNRGDTVVLCSTLNRWANRRATRHCGSWWFLKFYSKVFAQLGSHPSREFQFRNSGTRIWTKSCDQLWSAVISCDQLWLACLT